MGATVIDIHHDIIEACKQHDRNAQYRLYQLYAKAMYHICLRMMGNNADAEDMCQNVFIEVFSSIQKFRGDSTFGAWIRRITINKCYNELKKKKIPLQYCDEIPDDKMEDIEEMNYENIGTENIKAAIAQLPEGSRMIFNLYAFEDYTHEEIAKTLNISTSTSKTQYMRAKQKLQEILLKKLQS